MINLFEELFVLELANNHQGNLNKGLKIITEFSEIVRKNNIKAAIKFQFRDVKSIIHKDFHHRKDIDYIKKYTETNLSVRDFSALTEKVMNCGCLTMATPFDEKSVDLCMELNIQILKIASSSVKDKPLVEKVVSSRIPVIISTGGADVNDIDSITTLFKEKNIPFALNHCVSIYPSASCDLELNQIDFLKNRYPGITIGFSTHEYNNTLEFSMLIAYAKGARTFERHIDITDLDNKPSEYCSLPEDIDRWIKAFLKAKEICGKTGQERTRPNEKEIIYLDSLIRGIYAKKDLKKGNIISGKDIYFAFPLQKDQISCREITKHMVLSNDCLKDSPVLMHSIEEK
jgi:N-acetylneuraminate synthase